MRLALSNSFDPELPPPEALSVARQSGFDGFCLDGRRGRELAGPWARLLLRPESLREMAGAAGLALVSLSVSVDFAGAGLRSADSLAARLRGLMETCATAGFGRLTLADDSGGRGGPTEAIRGAMNVLNRIGESGHSARPAVETAGRLSRTRDVWTVLDSSTVSADAVYDFNVAVRSGDPPGIGVPRLARRLGIVNVDESSLAAMRGASTVVEAMHEARRLIELLRGVGYEGWICVRTDRPDIPSLRAAAEGVRAAWAAAAVPLAAYKGDKHAPRFAPREASRP